MAWIESHQSLSKHRKTLRAAAQLKIERHRLIGHLHELWWWGLDNADVNGYLGCVPNDLLAEAAGWPVKDSERWVQALVEAGGEQSQGFLDVVENGYRLHDWYDYAGKLNDQKELRRSSNRDAQSRRRQRLRQPIVSGVSADNADNQQSTGPDLTQPSPPNPPTWAERAAIPKPKRDRVPITEGETEALVGKYADRYGSPQSVRDEIELALNHTARLKNFNERLYVDGWLRRELEHRPAFRAAANGRAVQPATTRIIDRTGVEN